jgi:diacylglycerol kinase family enzyme
MMLIVNPKATTVSDRLKNLVVYALRGRYDVDAVETEGQGHAIALAQEAAHDGYDMVVAFGGDGTINEAANGLAGSPLPLSLLPGGCTNVVCRMLGVPTDVVDATEHLLGLAADLQPRAIDLGRINGRYFVSSTGLGMDADTTRWVDERTLLKYRAGPLSFAYGGLISFHRYRGKPRRMCVEVDGRRFEGVTAIFQNSDPYTYFNARPVRVCEGPAMDSGTLALAVLRDARRRDAPALARRLLRERPVVGHHQVEGLPAVREARVTAIPTGDGRVAPFPVQVDGDYIGDHEDAAIDLVPRSLLVIP